MRLSVGVEDIDDFNILHACGTRESRSERTVAVDGYIAHRHGCLDGSAAVLLFLVMDPLGNIPLFLSALRRVPPERLRRVILREMLIALVTLLLFLFLGGQMLRLLGLSQPALSAAGGIILMIIALRMVFPSREHSLHEEVAAEPFIARCVMMPRRTRSSSCSTRSSPSRQSAVRLRSLHATSSNAPPSSRRTAASTRLP